MKAPKTLQEAIQYFSDYENCRQFMVSIRWADGVVRCPHCNSEKVTYLEKARLYRCYGDHPKQKFSLKVGTVMEDSPIGLDKWLPAMWMLANCKNGISSYEIHRALGVTQKSAWFMQHRIRLAMQQGSIKTAGKLGGEGSEVEADETYIGGNLRKMHKDRRARYNNQRGAVGKAVVAGLLDRNKGEVRASVVPSASRGILQDQVRRHVEAGTALYTDEALAYYGLNYDYVHQVVNHAKEYVAGRVHTNGMENFWSLLKRGLTGTYIATEPYHLHRYVDEQVFRYNNRGNKEQPLNDGDRFSKVLSQIVGKRLTFAEVTGKVGETSI